MVVFQVRADHLNFTDHPLSLNANRHENECTHFHLKQVKVESKFVFLPLRVQANNIVGAHAGLILQEITPVSSKHECIGH